MKTKEMAYQKPETNIYKLVESVSILAGSNEVQGGGGINVSGRTETTGDGDDIWTPSSPAKDGSFFEE